MNHLIFRVLIRVVVFVLVLELLLRTGGSVFVSVQGLANRLLVRQASVFRILCAGDSFTISEQGYPVLLERMLAEKGHEKVRLIKEGISSASSAYIAARLDEWIKDYQPDMLVVMVGVNDDSTYTERRSVSTPRIPLNSFALRLAVGVWGQAKDALVKKFKRTSDISSITKIDAVSEVPEVWRIRLNKDDPRHDRMEKALTYLSLAAYLSEHGEHARAQEIFNNLSKVDISESFTRLVYEEMGKSLWAQGQYKEVAMIAHHILTQEPFNPNAQQWLMGLSAPQFNFELVARVFDSLIKNDPGNYRYYELYADCCNAHKLFDRRDDLLRQATAIKANSSNPVTASNLQKIKKICDQHNIPVVFMQYPLEDIRNLQRAFQYDRDYSKMLFVDNKPDFERLLETHTYDEVFTDHCCGTYGHGSILGTSAMAENLFTVIQPYLP
jgi:tetratricopeptide (TPR) repeat protein